MSKRGGRKVQPRKKSDSEDEQTPAEQTPAESEDALLTTSELERILTEQFKQHTEVLMARIDSLSAELVKAKDNAEEAIKLAQANHESIELLTSENIYLKDELKRIKDVEIINLENIIEDRTNRQLRKTLVFKNVPESDSETWEQTEMKLVEAIHTIAKVPIEEAEVFIERAHRAIPIDNRDGPRPIFAAFYDWKQAELVKDAFRKNNIENGATLMAEQKYGPLTTKRRNEALRTRKELKSSGKIINGYVAFPAKLMVRTVAGARYHMHKDFSKMKVVFNKK